MASAERDVWRINHTAHDVRSDAPTVLCLPGTMCSPHIFDCLAECGADVLAVPWLEWPRPHTMGALGAALSDLAETYRQVVILGHSTGGVVALSAALQAAEGTVTGVVICDSGANMAGHGDVDTIIARVEQEWGPRLWRRIARRSVAATPDATVGDMLTDYPARLDQQAVVQALRSQRDTDLSPRLARLGNTPALVVHGRHDTARPVSHAQTLTATVPAAELEILDCGHTPPVELPETFAATVNRWLRRHGGAGSC